MALHKIATDCAQAPAAFRLIFSRIYNLPALITDGRNIVGHFSTKWASLPTVEYWDPGNWHSALRDDLRFRAFLEAALSLASTQALPLNTYPVRLRDQRDPSQLSAWIRPGLIGLDERHARMIAKVEPDTPIPIKEIQSTLPRKIRQLLITPFTLFNYPTQMGRGLVAWRWPVKDRSGWRLLKPEAMPGFSAREQYELPDEPEAQARIELGEAELGIWRGFKETVPLLGLSSRQLNAETLGYIDRASALLLQLQDRRAVLVKTLGLYKTNAQAQYVGTFPELMMRLGRRRAPTASEMRADAEAIAHRLLSRVALVNEAQALLAENATIFDDPLSAAFDAYSTPDRDHFELFILAQGIRGLKLADPSGELAAFFVRSLGEQEIAIASAQKIDLQLWFEALAHGRIASDPRASRADRWGLGYAREKLALLPDLYFRKKELEKEIADYELLLSLDESQGHDLHEAQSALARQQNELAKATESIAWIEKIRFRYGL